MINSIHVPQEHSTIKQTKLQLQLVSKFLEAIIVKYMQLQPFKTRYRKNSNFNYDNRAGTYSMSSGLMTPYQTPCPMYFYCPLGTVDPTPCPDGTITLSPGAASISDCTPCPRGYYCLFGTYFTNQGSFNPQLIAGASSINANFG